MSCNLNIGNFVGTTANDPFLDENWKCRLCQRLAGSHPLELTQPGSYDLL
jgi:hypothetical protein